MTVSSFFSPPKPKGHSPSISHFTPSNGSALPVWGSCDCEQSYQQHYRKSTAKEKLCKTLSQKNECCALSASVWPESSTARTLWKQGVILTMRRIKSLRLRSRTSLLFCLPLQHIANVGQKVSDALKNHSVIGVLISLFHGRKDRLKHFNAVNHNQFLSVGVCNSPTVAGAGSFVESRPQSFRRFPS